MNSADNTVPPVLLCTERLTVRRVCVADYREMFRWSGDERVYRYLLANACKTPEDILPWLQRQDPEAEDRLVCILHGRSDSRPVGVVAFFFDAESDTWSFAYSLAYEEWGKGYATEATRAMMDYVRQTYGAHRFEAECATENSGSACNGKVWFIVCGKIKLYQA